MGFYNKAEGAIAAWNRRIREEVTGDAARWRWLRACGGWPDSEAAVSGFTPEQFDAMADTAIQAALPDPGLAQSEKQREVLTAIGITTRDYFAAKAMQAILSVSVPVRGLPKNSEGLAALAYSAADAMLGERNKP